MSQIAGNVEPYVKVPLIRIDENYSRFRFIDPRADVLMKKSIHQFGQISPVVVEQSEKSRYEMIDGFKRMRACRQLGKTDLKITIFKGGIRAVKAAILNLNWKVKSINDLEEAMVIKSLCREDGLTQVEVAALLGRHKSWVSRRLSLAERLHEEITNNIKLGLVSGSIARELAKLPRGNQEAALKCILKYNLNCRETDQLISELLQAPRWDHEQILRFPAEILDNRDPPRPRAGKKKNNEPLIDKITRVDRLFYGIDKLFDTKYLQNLAAKDRDLILSVLNRVEQIVTRIKDQLDPEF